MFIFVKGHVGLCLNSIGLNPKDCCDGSDHLLDFVGILECPARMLRVFTRVGRDDICMQSLIVWKVGGMLLETVLLYECSLA